MLLWANDWPDHSLLLPIPRTEYPDNRRLHRLLNLLSNWPAVLEQAQTHPQFRLVEGVQSDQHVFGGKGLPLPTVQGNSTLRTLELAVKNMKICQGHARNRDNHDMMHMGFAVASMIRLFSVVSPYKLSLE